MLLELTNEVQISEVRTTDALRALRSEWADLWARCPNATPFQSPDWAIAWWEHFGEGDLWVQVLRQQTHSGYRMIGVAPFFVRSIEGASRELLILGTGITDYLDILVEPEIADLCVSRVFQHLADNSHFWDTCDFQQLRPGASLLEAELGGEWLSSIAVQEVCPAIKLPPPGEDLAAVVPAHMLAKFRYYERRLDKTIPWSVDLANGGTFEELFEAFLRLHHLRWASRGGNGVIDAPSLQQFHYEVASRFLDKGVLRLFGLRANGNCIAALYAFMSGRRACYYFSGFDPEFQALNPGTILVGAAIRQAICEGATEFDFLRGREAYKYMWGARGRLNCRRRLNLLPQPG